MLKNQKNQRKVKVDFIRGCVILPDGSERPLYVSKKGVWFRRKIKPIFLTESNCIIS